MKQYLLPKCGNFYKANLHVHTTISDGKVTPEEVKAGYKSHGYSIVAFTDHEVFVPHNDLSDSEFLAINSVEIAKNDNMPGGFKYNKSFHMNLYAKSKEQTECAVTYAKNVFVENSKQYISEACAANKYSHHHSTGSMNDFIRRATDDGFLVCYNHPVWSLHEHDDYIGLQGIWGIEVLNYASARGGYVDTVQPFEELMNVGQRPVAIASDDAHSLAGSAYGGWNMIKARSLSYEDVMAAMERGDLYASSGPSIEELYIEDGVVHVKTSAAVSVFLLTDIRFTRVAHGTEEAPLTEASFDINEFINGERECKVCRRTAPRFRIEVKDRLGNKAWTRAYFLDELGLI